MKNTRTVWRAIGAFATIAIIGFVMMACGTVSADPTVYHMIVFNTNGGSAIASMQVPDGRPLTRPASPTRSGYNFAGG